MKRFVLKGLIKRNKNGRRFCTIPAIFGLRDWYVNRFNDLCAAHDYAYEVQSGKFKADYALLKGMTVRGYFLLAVPTAVFLMTIGLVYYYVVD